MQIYNLRSVNINSENILLELTSFQNDNMNIINSNNKDKIFNKIILDFKNIIDITLNLKYDDENLLKNLNNSKKEILEYLNNFISLIRNNNFLFCNEENFEKKLKINFSKTNIIISSYFPIKRNRKRKYFIK